MPLFTIKSLFYNFQALINLVMWWPVVHVASLSFETERMWMNTISVFPSAGTIANCASMLKQELDLLFEKKLFDVHISEKTKFH